MRDARRRGNVAHVIEHNIHRQPPQPRRNLGQRARVGMQLHMPP